MIELEFYDNVHLRVKTDPGTAYELQDYFTFLVPGYKFMPAYKNRVWDGKIRLFNPFTGLIYAGLREHIEVFARDRGYPITCPNRVPQATTDEDIEAFVKSLNPALEPRDYQLMAFREAINNKRHIFLSPTASGKSFIIYLIIRWIMRQKKRTLVIVPTTTLVGQMYKDFVKYNNGNDLPIHCIFDGAEKKNDAPITISTWQSIYKLRQPWFADFAGIIGDEVHTFKAKSLKSIMEKSVHTEYRIGTTGTLDGTETHRLVLEGLFGPVRQVTTYEQLHHNKQIAPLSIKIILFNHSDENKKLLQKAKYPDEVQFLVQHQQRNLDIVRLTSSLKGNILVLYNRVDKHGKPLHEALKKALPNRDHYIVHGGVDTEDRENIRQFLEQTEHGVATCSYKTFGTGINVERIHHIIFASPTKSRITVLQSIGRGLRMHETKDKLTVWDLADDLRKGQWANHTFKHLEERINIYNESGFTYTVHKRNIS